MEKSIEVDGLRIAYERAGAGPPLVLLHGFVGDARSTWGPQIPALADAFTVIAWDAPGAGDSDDPPEDLGAAGYADLLARFVERLALGRPHVAGLSFGAIVALALADRHPGVLRTLALVSGYAGWRGSLGPRAAEERLRRSLAVSELPPDAFVDALLPTMFSEGTPAAVVAAFGAAVREAHPAGFRAMARASAEDLREALPGIGVPTLVLAGDRDTRSPLEVARALHAAIPGSELAVIEGAGHVCTLEAPEAVGGAIRRFAGRR